MSVLEKRVLGTLMITLGLIIYLTFRWWVLGESSVPAVVTEESDEGQEISERNGETDKMVEGEGNEKFNGNKQNKLGVNIY